jgi:hypothetical protein
LKYSSEVIAVTTASYSRFSTTMLYSITLLGTGVIMAVAK